MAAKGLAIKRFAIGRGVQMQDEAEPTACAGGEREPARRCKIGRFACELGNNHSHGVALERFLHGP